MGLTMDNKPTTTPVAWWRESVHPECLPCVTTDPDIAQQWRNEGHNVLRMTTQTKAPLPCEALDAIYEAHRYSRYTMPVWRSVARAVERAHGIE